MLPFDTQEPLDALLDTPTTTFYNGMNSMWKHIVAMMAQGKGIQTAEKQKFVEDVFLVKMMSWLIGEATTSAEITKEPDSVKALPLLAVSLQQKPAWKAIELAQDHFKRQDIPTINPKVIEKMWGASQVDAERAAQRMSVTAQRAITTALAGGLTGREAIREIKKEGVTSGYATNVYRTNAHTAYNQATYQRAVESSVVDGFRYLAIRDRRARDNHTACYGLEQPIDSEWWDYLYPPLGYNCRCRVVAVVAGLLKPHVPAGLSLPAVKGNSKGYADTGDFGKRPVL